jgi:hypothetical protein
MIRTEVGPGTTRNRVTRYYGKGFQVLGKYLPSP